MQYIEQKKTAECFFCEKPKQGKDRENLILHRVKEAFVMMNLFPYNNGHLMIAPYRHVVNIDKLSRGEWNDVFFLLQKSVKALRRALNPHGFNVGINVGDVAGAGADHLHVHVVPRWRGDTSFMPVVGATKVMPEHLKKTYEKLVPYF
ncbi:MAG: HIT domain-containing protein [Candidatus Bathyarchaeia archaeon]